MEIDKEFGYFPDTDIPPWLMENSDYIKWSSIQGGLLVQALNLKLERIDLDIHLKHDGLSTENRADINRRLEHLNIAISEMDNCVKYLKSVLECYPDKDMVMA